MLTTSARPASFSIAQARELVRDLFVPKPWLYWTDFLTSIAVGVSAFVVMRFVMRGLVVVPAAPLVATILFAIATCAFYRASLFTHELTHLKQGSFRGFRLAWNVLFGVPFLMPSFLYHTHVDHHARRQYGTEHDGEYLPLANGPPWHIVFYLAQAFVLPAIAIGRFLVLAPLGWLIPPFRHWIARHASSMVIDVRYVRPLPTRQEVRIWRVQEVGCWLSVTSLTASLAMGWLPLGFGLWAYAIASAVLTLNAIRTLGAHRYRSTGETMSFVEQLLDSVNYPRWPLLSSLWAPLGLRFHALHHLFPSMPYHALAEAHRRLMAGLPADSPYRQTESDSLWSTIAQLWREARESSRREVAADLPPESSPVPTGGKPRPIRKASAWDRRESLVEAGAH
ncbi:MAG: fatty acid desaturase [Pirellulales bacterium]|nr:fatty acid desaturase [Pirellulales bacterium]